MSDESTSWQDQVVTAFKDNDVNLVSYLPGSSVDGLITQIEADDYFTTVRVTREEQALGVVSGGWLVHTRGAVICQSSGLANSINALTSLNDVAGIPFIGLVARRGDLGEFNAAQVPFGYHMPAVLDILGIRNHPLESTDHVLRDVDMAIKSAFSTAEPYILTLEPTLVGAKDEY